jgi:tetratricopeptide (TPR) repeat protein
LERTGRYFEAFELAADAIDRYPKGPYAQETGNILKSAFTSLVGEGFAGEDYLSLADLYFKNYRKGFYGQTDEDSLMKIATALQKISFNKEALEMFNYMDAVCKDGTVREAVRKNIEILKQGDAPAADNLLSGGDRLYVEGKYQEAAQWYEGALSSPDMVNKRWILYRLSLCKLKLADGDGARKNIAGLKGGGEDPFWAKVADYLTDEDRRQVRYRGVATN